MAARRPVTLQEALALAEKRNPDLAAARAQAAQVAAKTKLVISALLPEVSLTTSYVHTTLEQKFDTAELTKGIASGLVGALQTVGPAYGLPQQANPAVLSAFQDQLTSQSSTPTVIVAPNSLYGSLVLSQLLFLPQFFLLPAAKEAEEAAKLGSLEAREQVLLAVARVYLGLEGLTELENAPKDAEGVALKRERDAKAQVSVGTNTEIAVLRAQTETAQARAVIATLAGQRIALMELLEALCGDPIRPRDDQPTTLDITAQAEATEPWSTLYGIRASKLGLLTQEHFNFVDHISWLPNLVAQAKGSYNSNKGFAGTNWGFDAILALQWTLYDRGVRYVTMHENEAKTVQQRAQLEGQRTKARATWIGAKTNLAAAQVSLEQAQSQAQLAARAQKQIESAYQTGVATSLEVSDIDSKRFFAASTAAQARAQVEMRKMELAAAEGRLAKVVGLSDEGVREDAKP